MGIREDMSAQIDWRWFIASWAPKLLTEKYSGYRAPGSEKADAYAAGVYHYTHVAKKYLTEDCGLENHDRNSMMSMLHDLVSVSRTYAVQWGLPMEFWPTMEDSAMRLLYYPPGATIAHHTDFNLFTVNLWRNLLSPYHHLDSSCKASPPSKVHWGELWQKVMGDPATEHYTRPSTKWQYSVVFFAMPPLSAVLPDGQTVGDWLTKRKQEART